MCLRMRSGPRASRLLDPGFPPPSLYPERNCRRPRPSYQRVPPREGPAHQQTTPTKQTTPNRRPRPRPCPASGAPPPPLEVAPAPRTSSPGLWRAVSLPGPGRRPGYARGSPAPLPGPAEPAPPRDLLSSPPRRCGSGGGVPRRAPFSDGGGVPAQAADPKARPAAAGGGLPGGGEHGRDRAQGGGRHQRLGGQVGTPGPERHSRLAGRPQVCIACNLLHAHPGASVGLGVRLGPAAGSGGRGAGRTAPCTGVAWLPTGGPCWGPPGSGHWTLARP